MVFFAEVSCPILNVSSFKYGSLKQDTSGTFQSKTFSFSCEPGFKVFPQTNHIIQCVNKQESFLGEWHNTADNTKVHKVPECLGKEVKR